MPDNSTISAEQMHRVLEVTRMLAVTTDLDPLLHAIATAACELVDCERSSIFLHDEQTDELWTKVALQTQEIRVPASAGIVGQSFKNNRVEHVPKPYEDPRFNREVDKRTGFVTRNILAAPMVNIDREPIGVIQTINKRERDFDFQDREMIQLLAAQAGVAIQRHRLQLAAMESMALKHEMNLARQVQEAMIPKNPPEIPGLHAVGWAKPASITGGDAYDLWKLPDGRLGIFLADASGHGIAPTLIVSQVRTLVRSISETETSPHRVFERVNSRVAQDLELGRFATAFIGFMSSDGLLEWACAGHGPVLHRLSCDEPLLTLDASGMPLGVMPDWISDPTTPVQLKPTGSLLLVSDGIFEASTPQGEQFGIPRMLKALDDRRRCTPRELIDGLQDDVLKWQVKDEPADDQTIVVVQRQG